MSAGEAPYRIGDVAQRAGVTTRTLRYYQELGLLAPAGASPGGSRRYSEADVVRLLRILELRNVMGFDLDKIGVILNAEDRLTALRHEAARGISTKRRREMLDEAVALNHQMQAQVQERLAVLEAFLGDLEEKEAVYRERVAELGAVKAVGR
ncbi:MAG: putative transcriptional regulator [Acidimicrobiales bacterium]|jgi:DNA-binding transcriptional MerR regulator|nr:putative transcriptional regulator [Acidimicrobiales bacterium]